MKNLAAFRACATALCVASYPVAVYAQDTESAQCFAESSRGWVNAIRLLAIATGNDTLAIDKAEELNDARAEAERIMNDPANAFNGNKPSTDNNQGVPTASQPSGPDIHAACPARPLTCNPIGVPATIVTSGQCTTSYSVECYEKTSEVDAYYTYGDCIYKDGQFTFIRRGGEHEMFYENIVPRVDDPKSPGNKIYPGQSFANFCLPCGVPAP